MELIDMEVYHTDMHVKLFLIQMPFIPRIGEKINIKGLKYFNNAELECTLFKVIDVQYNPNEIERMVEITIENA